jgi:hypothetical protein
MGNVARFTLSALHDPSLFNFEKDLARCKYVTQENLLHLLQNTIDGLGRTPGLCVQHIPRLNLFWMWVSKDWKEFGKQS